MTVRRCGLCNAETDTASFGATHVVMPGERILCGEFSRTTLLVTFEVSTPPTPTDAQRVRSARAELETIMEIVAHHIRQHGGPPEVESEHSWIDLTDLLQPLETALG
jgi:hypothetical protein